LSELGEKLSDVAWRPNCETRNYLVIPFDNKLCQKWAEITSIPGQPLSYSDSWIAATALRHGIHLVTHNGKHFENIPGLSLITEKDPD
jgi:predicted nucleic acid-binding protein